MSRKPRILIGSSSEGAAIAECLQGLLQPDVEAQLWSQNFFEAGDTTIETLERKIRDFDGAVIVGTADDKLTTRGQEHPVMRDNLLFEFGLFSGVLGRRRSLLAVESLGSTKLPSDLFGLTCLGFERSDPLEISIGPLAGRIKARAQKWSEEPVAPEVHERLNRLLRLSLARIQEVSGIHSGLGLHVYAAKTREGAGVLTRVGRARSTPKSPQKRDFAKGNGVTGRCWELGAAVHVDFTQEPYASCTEEAWNNMGADVRCGMDYALLDDGRKRYSVVAAHPIVSQLATGFEFLGCIALNLGLDTGSDPACLRASGIERVLDDCVEMIAVLLESVQ